jgi:hypothetical protein
MWSPADLRLRQWVLENRGACQEVATACDVSREFVRLVLYGKRGGRGRKGSTAMVGKIKMMLKRKGAPIA